ncbi:VOC family protein [Phytoactinopolyspora endophytica]|uniref:VOC family protein n=1 Tax=Phytoactinopolyspora endophytica TaxID=1642495 RepID=UPI00101C1E48|nr:VOC family protein [Phytoactinopolyspora endophytica]
MSGKVVHFEIPFDDGDRARNFYREAFGWTVLELPEMSYTMATSGPTTEDGMPSEPGFINGGMLQRGVGPSTGPVITVDVESIDAALETIEKAGGSAIVGKEAVANLGYAAYFRDPEGNIMGLWENAPQG